MTDYTILGAGGQVGRGWTALLGHAALPLSRAAVDLARPGWTDVLEAALAGRAPRAIINAAAATRVDAVESEKGRAEAFRVNAEAVGELARWCAARALPLVHYSTDYVFDGRLNRPYRENDATAPLNGYGRSKRAGEEAVIAAGGRFLIFRTSWVYDAYGHNFVTTIRRLLREKDTLRVVDDQIGAPTYAPHLAAASYAALTHALAAPVFPSGIYHLCAAGETSWHGFAKAIFTLARSRDSGIRCTRIDPIPTAEYPTPAARPLNSRLDCSKAAHAFDVRIPAWEEGLKECVTEIYGR